MFYNYSIILFITQKFSIQRKPIVINEFKFIYLRGQILFVYKLYWFYIKHFRYFVEISEFISRFFHTWIKQLLHFILLTVKLRLKNFSRQRMYMYSIQKWFIKKFYVISKKIKLSMIVLRRCQFYSSYVFAIVCIN